MSNPFFRFKQFTVRHDRCAMKVGTDGVLLGAWAPILDLRLEIGDFRILDVGTGTGLIALMLAQRCPTARIDAIDIDTAAVEQARENVAASPWAERIRVEQADFGQWQQGPYQLIVSNPPYFVDSLKNPDAGRRTARHTDSLAYATLFGHTAELLTADGVLAVILPAESEAEARALGREAGLNLRHITRVSSKPGREAKRVLMAFQKEECLPEEDTLTIESEDAPRSAAYVRLTEEFYL